MRSDLKKFYNQADTQVDVNSTDFANVMAYLREHGLPDPQVVVQEVGTPTGIRYTDIELVYTHGMRPPLMMQAFLVLNRPQGAVVDFKLWSGELSVTTPPEYEPPQGEIPPDPPKPKPIILVGGVMHGTLYYPIVGDDSPNGTRYIDGRGTFVKNVTRTPFGNSVYWTKV